MQIKYDDDGDDDDDDDNDDDGICFIDSLTRSVNKICCIVKIKTSTVKSLVTATAI